MKNREGAYTANLLGAFVLHVADSVREATSHSAGIGGEGPAALTALLFAPDSTIGNLAATLNISHPGAALLSARLEARGLIQRRAGKDARERSLRLTAGGRRLARSLLAARRNALERILGSLGPDDREILQGLLEAALASMTKGRRSADQICRLCDESCCPDARCPVERACRRVEGGVQSRPGAR